MLGELEALLTALIWAIGTSMLKPLSRFHPVLLNQVRCFAAAFLFVPILAATGGFAHLGEVPPPAALFAIAGTFSGIMIGDSLFVLALRHIDVSRAYPIANCTNPLITIVVAYFALSERISSLAWVGVVLVLAGIYFVAFPRGPLLVKFSVDSPQERKGLMILLATIFFWGISIIGIKMGTRAMDMPTANFVRFLGAVILMIPFTFSRWKQFKKDIGWRTMSLAAFNGAFTYGVGGIFFLWALQQTGAAMTAVLSATSPLFLVPMAVFFLKEKVTPKLIMGVVLSVAGICVVFLA
ncbi:MAG: DMT family transporter [Dehalococcoidales bacterium]|nr:DMT family transporter [Dehalococcoidales bacterium]